MLAIDLWSCSAAVQSASFKLGSIRKVSVVVLAVAMVFRNAVDAVNVMQCTVKFLVVEWCSIHARAQKPMTRAMTTLVSIRLAVLMAETYNPPSLSRRRTLARFRCCDQTACAVDAQSWPAIEKCSLGKILACRTRLRPLMASSAVVQPSRRLNSIQNNRGQNSQGGRQRPKEIWEHGIEFSF